MIAQIKDIFFLNLAKALGFFLIIHFNRINLCVGGIGIVMRILLDIELCLSAIRTDWNIEKYIAVNTQTVNQPNLAFNRI